MWLYLEGDLISAPRGSDLLKHRYTERDLEELLQASAIDGVELVDFFPKGIPARIAAGVSGMCPTIEWPICWRIC